MKKEKQEMDDRSRSSTVIREPKPPRGHEDSRSPDEIAVDNILEEGVRELAQSVFHLSILKCVVLTVTAQLLIFGVAKLSWI